MRPMCLENLSVAAPFPSIYAVSNGYARSPISSRLLTVYFGIYYFLMKMEVFAICIGWWQWF